METSSILEKSEVFKGLKEAEIQDLLENVHFQIKNFKKGNLIAQMEDPCQNLMVLLKGSVKGEMLDASGKSIKIEDIVAPQSVGSIFLFGSQNTLPVNIIANNDVEMLLIPRSSILELFKIEKRFLLNYLNNMADRTQFLTQKLRSVSFKTIKGKLAGYILGKLPANSKEIKLDKTQQELAELFGVARPSLARAMGEMQYNGIIVIEKKTISIKDRGKLEELVL